MAKVQVKPKPDSLGLRQVAIVTFAAVLFYKAQRASCEVNSTTSEVSSSTSSPSPICPDYCNLPPDSATRSKAPFHRWYFDSKVGACKRFRWGGRGGNKNRFFRKVTCEETCSKCSSNDTEVHKAEQEDGADKDNVCSLSIDEGRCTPKDSQTPPGQPQLVWHFDSDKEKCSPFIFYGCGGNSNRFLSKVDCEEICQ